MIFNHFVREGECTYGGETGRGGNGGGDQRGHGIELQMRRLLLAAAAQREAQAERQPQVFLINHSPFNPFVA